MMLYPTPAYRQAGPTINNEEPMAETSFERANSETRDACERGRCNHDLARAALVDELWGADGPYPLKAKASVAPDEEETDLARDEEGPTLPFN